MNKKQLLVLLVLVALAGAAAYRLRIWLRPDPIQIECIIRRTQAGRRLPAPGQEAPSGRPGYDVTFAFSHKVGLTAVQVFPLQDVMTNKYPHAIWNLCCASNAVPVKSIIYGARVRGLQPTVKEATAYPLAPGGSYRLVIHAGDEKAEKDFQMPQ